MRYHAATHSFVSASSDDPDDVIVAQPSVYCGIVDQAHVDLIRELAEPDDAPRFFKTHPHDPTQFFVIRDDGHLDHYVGIPDDEEVE